ncbi:MAG: PAS domain S-box protein [Verrucomicrobia bacterium]|nr:PAS domain S-box protein [Verrucomicrobiota bacterium]
MSTGQVRVLAIDDIQDSLDLIGHVLRAHFPGAELVTALNGTEGIQKARTSQPSIILLDVLMPEMDGFEACRRLKSDPATAHIPVLMISGIRVADIDRTIGVQSGADGYLCKPYEPNELISQIHSLLRISANEQHLREQREELRAELSETLRHLEDQRNYLKSLFDESPDAIFVEDVQGNVLDVNRRACELHDLSREELIGKNVLDLVPPEERERVAGDFPKWSAGSIHHYSGFSYKADGTAIPVEIRRSSIIHKGQEAHLLHVRDVSERVEAEKKIQFTEFSLAHASLAAFWVAEDASFAYANEAAARSLGYTKEELLSMGVPDIDPLYTAEAWPEHWKVFSREKVLTFESLHRRKDGTTFPVEITTNYVEVDGKPFMFSFAQNIAERKQAEESLRQSEARFRELVALLPELIFEISPDGHVLFANRTGLEMFGYTEEELAAGLNAFNMFARRDVPRVVSNMSKVVRGENIGHTEYMAKRKNGTFFPVSAYVAPIIKEGTIVGLRGIGVDVTDRKRAEEIEARMMQADKLESIGVLAGGIAHDFNNILMSIIGYCDLALQDSKEGNDVRGHLEEIMSAGKRARTLIKQIQTFSRESDSEKKPVDIRSVVQEALHFLRVSIPVMIRIDTDLHEDCGTIAADPTQVHQVVMNICTNAYQAMESTGGVLRIAVEPIEVTPDLAARNPDLHPGPYVRLIIEDNGPGIDPYHLPRIFDPFFTTKDPTKGTGLGLSVVHGIISGHHGAVTVESEPGKGTRFEIYLPRAKTPAADATASTQELQPQKGTERILCVDDEERIAQLSKRLLETLGYTADSFSSSAEALAAFRENPDMYDLVLTDLAMPELTGTELASTILQIRPDIPIVLCTGYNQTVTQEEVVRTGISKLVHKPFTRDQIARDLRELLDRKG